MTWTVLSPAVMMRCSSNQLRIYKINPQTNKPQNNLKGNNSESESKSKESLRSVLK